MAKEIFEIPEMISRQLESIDVYLEAGRQLKRDKTRGIITCARGTSDHAAMYFKYLIETQIGIPVASVGPSVASVYDTKLQLQGFACLTFSQSGGSPDLLALQLAAKQGGAMSFAILNQPHSPVGNEADHVLPIFAGPEKAVAATKSFVGMLIASLGIVAGYLEERKVIRMLHRLPDISRETLNCDWSNAAIPLVRRYFLFCIGRGLNMAIAAEAALKLKETCRLHAEAYSAAELLHGPVVIADEKIGALVFGTNGRCSDSITSAYRKLRDSNAQAYLIGSESGELSLQVPAVNNELLEPVIQAVAFYKFVEHLSIAVGENPDAPPGLVKITKTL